MQLAEWLERGSGEGEDALAERQLAADPQLLAAVIGTGRGPSSLRSTALPGPARQAPGRRRWLADRRRASQVAHAATLMLAVIGGLALGRDLATTRLQTEVRHLQVLLSFDAEYPAMPGGSP
jgi:hypothetical protein